MSAITLTRDEAVAVATSALDCTLPGWSFDAVLEDPEWRRRFARRLPLEVAIRDGGGWWGEDRNPTMLDIYAQGRGTPCPDSFEMTADGVSAIVEMLPEMFADAIAMHASNVEDGNLEENVAPALRCVYTLESLAARLGVEIPAREAVSS